MGRERAAAEEERRSGDGERRRHRAPQLPTELGSCCPLLVSGFKLLPTLGEQIQVAADFW